MNLEDLKIENEKLKSENQSLKNEIQKLKDNVCNSDPFSKAISKRKADNGKLMVSILDDLENKSNIENNILDDEIYYLEEIRSHGDPPETIMSSTKNKEQLRILLGKSEMNYTYGTHIIDHGTKKEMKEKYPQYFND